MYLISVIITIYNAEEYLKRTIDSVVNQTIGIENLEVILINDCSNDSSKEIIDTYCNKYSNFIPVHLKENGGSSNARNVGIKKATTNYIMFLDDDDEYDIAMCETLYKKIEEYDVDLVSCNVVDIYPYGSSKFYILDKSIKEKVVNSKEEYINQVGVWNKIHKKDFLIKNNLFFKFRNGEDLIFSTLEYLYADKVLILNNYFGYKYYIRDNSNSKTQTIDNYIETLKAFYYLTDKLNEIDKKDVLTQRLNYFMSFFLYRFSLFGGKNKDAILIMNKIHDFEKYCECNLTLDSSILNILNKLIINKNYKLAITFIKSMQLSRKYLNKIRIAIK